MGQYYTPTSLDKKEWVYSHDYGNGLKLMEHSYIGNSFVAVVENLLSPNGTWHKTRIVWAGDYGDEKLFLEGFDNVVAENDDFVSGFEVHNVSSYADKYFTKIQPKNNNRIELLHYVVNHSKKEYVDLNKCIGESLIVHPLPLLTSNGNGQGGGDYRGHNEYMCGRWAGDVISAEKELPIDFNEIVPNFYR